MGETRGDAHLMRTWYRTDVLASEPEYGGTVSATIPASAFRQGQIVDVDWSEHGQVQVTFLLDGRGRDG